MSANDHNPLGGSPMKTTILLLGAALLAPLSIRAAADLTPATAPAGPPPMAGTLYPVEDLRETALYKLAGVYEGENLQVGSNAGKSFYHPGHFRRFELVNVLTGERRKVFACEPRDPKQAPMLQAFEAAGPDAPLIVTTQRDLRCDMVVEVTPYVLRDGEERPNVFLFVASQPAGTENNPAPAVKLYKFGQFAIVHLLARPLAAKDHAPDPLADAVSHLQPGQMVEVETSGSAAAPILRKITAIPPLQTGTLTKTGLEDIDGIKTPGAHITIGGEDRVFLIPGKRNGKDRWMTDNRIFVQVKACKLAGQVSFRAYEENGHWWLREIANAKPSIFNK
jgi:hypothetical protein